MKPLIFTLPLFALFSCVNPENYYKKGILDLGFIPYTSPISDTLPGALYTNSTPDNLLFAGGHEECFPKDSLRRSRNVDTPDKLKSSTFSSSVDTKFFESSGNNLFNFTFDTKSVKEISYKMSGVSFEGISYRGFANYFLNEMDEYCREDLLSDEFTFIIGTIKVDQLEFVFKSNSNSNIKLTSERLAKIINISADVKWEIKNEYTLVIKSPKYIGYHMGKISRQGDDSYKLSIATSYEHTNEKYHYTDVHTFGKRKQGFLRENPLFNSSDDSLNFYLE